jgi:hypothetical protein
MIELNSTAIANQREHPVYVGPEASVPAGWFGGGGGTFGCGWGPCAVASEAGSRTKVTTASTRPRSRPRINGVVTPTASASDTRSARGVGMRLTIRIDDLEGPELEST